MSAPNPNIDPAFGTGLHTHLAQARARRFAQRFNHEGFLTRRELREALEREDLPFAA